MRKDLHNIILPDETFDVLTKGKKAEIGEIRNWGGKKLQKQVNGEWKELKESVFPTKISTEGLSKDQLRKIAEVVKNTRAMSSWFGQKSKSILKSLKEEIEGVILCTPVNEKTNDSIVRKVKDEFAGDISECKDLVRNTFICEEENLEKVKQKIREGFKVTREKNQTADKFDGYSGTIFNIEFPNGTIGEVQVNTPQMIYGKESESISEIVLTTPIFEKLKKSDIPGGKGHKFYEIMRSKSATLEDRQKAKEESVKYYNLVRKLKL